MNIIVTQGRAEATVEISPVGGVSLAEVICEGLGYAQIELESVIATFPNTDKAVQPSYQVGYRIGKDTSVFFAQIRFER